MTVECADCGCSTRVLRRSAVMGAVTRVVECPCGSRFETVEKIARRLPSQVQLSTGSQQGLNTGLKQRLNPVQTREISVMGGGIGGSDLCPFLIRICLRFQGISCIRHHGLSRFRRALGEVQAGRQAISRGVRRSFGGGKRERRGNKEPAFKAWQRVKPPLRLTSNAKRALRRQTGSSGRGGSSRTYPHGLESARVGNASGAPRDGTAGPPQDPNGTRPGSGGCIMGKPIAILRRTNRELQRILAQVERVRRLCDQIESAVWTAVGAPKRKRPR